MDSLYLLLGVMALLMFVLFTGVWIFAGLLFVSIFSLAVFAGFPLDRVGRIATTIIMRNAGAWEMAAIPMFIWMGELIVSSRMSERIFRGLRPFVYWLPGGLLHTNVAGCTLFASVSGSSVATTASIGKITLPRLAQDGYPNSLAIGSLAGAGTFGLLIPPSVSLIIYGVQAEVSITGLFMAGIVPGLVMAALYSIYIMIVSPLYKVPSMRSEPRPALRDYAMGLWELSPLLLLVIGVMGSIYSGIATPSEAAAVGAVLSLLYALTTRSLTVSSFMRTIVQTVMISSTILVMVAFAAVLASAMGYLHLPQDLGAFVTSFAPETWQLLILLAVFYILLGIVLEGASIILTSLPLVLPVVLAAGIDPIWFGVFLIITIEMGTITPPVGFSLFVLRSITGRGLWEISRYAFPFFLLMVLMLVLISIWPQIVLWLPSM